MLIPAGRAHRRIHPRSPRWRAELDSRLSSSHVLRRFHGGGSDAIGRHGASVCQQEYHEQGLMGLPSRLDLIPRSTMCKRR